MKREFSIPPSRELPRNRLAQRREHLVSEIAQPPPEWRLRRRPLLALVAAALIVVGGTASAIGGVRDFFLDRGFIGLPPMGATPSTPESGELVVHWEGRSASLAIPDLTPGAEGYFRAPLVRAWVYADGRLIWSTSDPVPGGANDVTSGYLEQRLTPEGVELMRSTVAELFERSRDVIQTVDPADELLVGRAGPTLVVPRSSMWGAVVAPSGDGFAALGWGEPERERVGDVAATPEQLAALRRVDTLLTDPMSVLPSSAWAVRKVRAYVPSHYAVCINASPPQDASQLLPLLPTRAANVLGDKSRTPSEGDVVASPDKGGPVEVQGRWVEYCSKVTTEEAREVVEALSPHDKEPGYYAKSITLRYRLTEGAHWWEGAGIRVEPYFPDGTFIHSDAG